MISRFSFSTFTKNRKKQHIKSTSLTILINATLTAASLINLIFHWKGKLLHQRQVSSISKMHKKYVSVVSPSFPELYYLSEYIKAKLPGSSKFSPSFPVLRLIFFNNFHIISLTFNSFLFSQSKLREQQRDAQKNDFTVHWNDDFLLTDDGCIVCCFAKSKFLQFILQFAVNAAYTHVPSLTTKQL